MNVGVSEYSFSTADQHIYSVRNLYFFQTSMFFLHEKIYIIQKAKMP